MVRPDYDGGSILNVTATLQHGFGADTPIPGVRGIDPTLIGQARNVVFIVIDGMGQGYLDIYGADTFFQKYRKTTLTSVFPSTTATAITSFVSGVEPVTHAITGWFMHLRELGAASVILPLAPRFCRESYQKWDVKGEDIFNFPSVFESVPRKSFNVSYHTLKDSAYTKYSCRNSLYTPYENLDQFFANIAMAAKESTEKKFIYAYWSQLDHLEHHKGKTHPDTLAHLRELSDGMFKLADELRGSDTLIIMTADHGLIDTDMRHHLSMKDYPHLAETLTLPLCGEPRVPYCYVSATCREDFLAIVRGELSPYCDVYSRDEIIDLGLYGKGPMNPRFRQRIGDYILMMKDRYILKDGVLGEEIHDFIGYHGGLTDDEMLVPLIVAEF